MSQLSELREPIWIRQNGLCPVCGVWGQPNSMELHHRQLRRHGNHLEDNLLMVHRQCHVDVHSSPKLAALRYEMGWLVRSTDDPAAVPVRTGSRVLR